MRITPLEIRQKSFEKNFRGYDKDEVNAFLMTLSQEWQRTLDEVKEMKLKLETADKEVAKLREVESSLYKTLKTAEDTGANVIEQARQAADLHLRESNMRAEAMLSEAKSKAKDCIEEADMKAKEIIADMEDRLKLMVENYKRLETSREDLMADMKRIANDAIERVERARAQTKSFDADQHLKVVRNQVKKQPMPTQEVKPGIVSQEIKETLIEREIVVEQSAVTVASAKPVFKSFFDEIG
ncbi:MAG: DivIVA domain-containing protein [Cytophagia bacterium]|nr:DivIVA domain-containing protein [Cytophagia bacterium]